MKAIVLFTTVTVLSASPAQAGSGESAQVLEGRSPAKVHAAVATDLVSMQPSNISREIASLRRYGSRFERVIQSIEKAKNMPSWGWEDACDDDASDPTSEINW